MSWYSTSPSGQMFRIDVADDGSLLTTAVSQGSFSAEQVSTPKLTGQALVKRAMRMIGATATGENLKASEERDGLEALNHLLDSWNAESIMVYAATRKELVLDAKSPQTIGIGGDLNTTRPVRIEQGHAYLKIDGREYPLEVMSQEKFAEIANKGQGGIPRAMTYDAAYPLGNVSFYPVPEQEYMLVLYTPVQLDAVDATSDISLPPGYADAIVWNLALMLGPEYGKKDLAAIGALAAQKKQVIARANQKPIEMSCDAALLRNCNSLDIRSGR